MRTMVPVVAALALAACSVPDARLSFVIHPTAETMAWRGEQVKIRQSLEDPLGLAGIEIEVLGIGQTVSVSATDFFLFQGGMATRQVRVPDSGRISVIVTLRQNGDIVAEGAASWLLEPEINWGVGFYRAPYLPTEGLLEHTESPPCLEWLGCYENWRIPIRGDAVNYEGEALWVRLSKSGICEHCVY